MRAGPPPLPPSYRGYVSPLAKKAFTSRAIVLAALYIAVQFLVPFLVSAGSVFRTFFVQGMNMSFLDPASAVFHQGKLWFLQSKAVLLLPEEPDSTTQLVSLLFEEENPSLQVEAITDVNPFGIQLVPTEEKFFLVDYDQIGTFQEGVVTWASLEETICLDSKPFLLENELHGIKDSNEGQILLRFNGNAWEERARLFLLPPGVEATPLRKEFIQNLQIVNHKNMPHCFARIKEKLYHRLGLPQADEAFNLEDWTLIGPVGKVWKASASEMDIAAFDLGSPSQPTTQVRAYRRNGQTWKPFFSKNLGLTVECTVVGGEGEAFYLVTRGVSNACTIQKLQDGEALKKRHLEAQNTMFRPELMGAMLLPQCALAFLPILVLPFLNLWMKRYRVTKHCLRNETLQYASLLRRGPAKAIDLIFVGTPMALTQLRWIKDLSNMDSLFQLSSHAFQNGLYVFLSLLWAAAMLAVLGAMEGKTGYSLGKYLLGIRVVAETHELCGIKRGILRNMLFLGDAFFFGGVGLFFVAFTENWQRLGDLVVKTIVVAPGSTTGTTS